MPGDDLEPEDDLGLGPAYEDKPDGVIKAAFRSKCPECNGPINLGQEIIMGKSGRWEHWRCAP